MLWSAHMNLSLNIKTSPIINLGWVSRAQKCGKIGPCRMIRFCREIWWSDQHDTSTTFQAWDFQRLTVCSVHMTHMHVNLHELLNYNSREICDLPYLMHRPLRPKTWLLIWHPCINACLARFCCIEIADSLLLYSCEIPKTWEINDHTLWFMRDDQVSYVKCSARIVCCSSVVCDLFGKVSLLHCSTTTRSQCKMPKDQILFR